jgi:hypothetical protein
MRTGRRLSFDLPALRDNIARAEQALRKLQAGKAEADAQDAMITTHNNTGEMSGVARTLGAGMPTNDFICNSDYEDTDTKMQGVGEENVFAALESCLRAVAQIEIKLFGGPVYSHEVDKELATQSAAGTVDMLSCMVLDIKDRLIDINSSLGVILSKLS